VCECVRVGGWVGGCACVYVCLSVRACLRFCFVGCKRKCSFIIFEVIQQNKTVTTF
jgi:hypothetical protein